jgi:hypothetical protein
MAFVVRFSAESDAERGPIEGRIEHVASGEKARFGSLAELWAFVRTILVRGSVASDAWATGPPAASSQEDKLTTPGGPHGWHAAPAGTNPQRRER